MSKPLPAQEIIVHPIAGQVVHQRTRDAYVDATAMCQAAGKRLNNYLRAERTKRFVKALEAETRIRATELVQVVTGGYPELQGTWVHPRVAVHLGQWLSVEFEVWVTGIIDDWREMQKLLRPTPTDWTKQFPDEFYESIARAARLAVARPQHEPAADRGPLHERSGLGSTRAGAAACNRASHSATAERRAQRAYAPDARRGGRHCRIAGAHGHTAPSDGSAVGMGHVHVRGEPSIAKERSASAATTEAITRRPRRI